MPNLGLEPKFMSHRLTPLRLNLNKSLKFDFLGTKVMIINLHNNDEKAISRSISPRPPTFLNVQQISQLTLILAWCFPSTY